MKTHYEVLGVHPTAEPLVIEAAYKALLKRYHPDVATGDPKAAEERSKLINEAYRVLRDPALRTAYDRKLGDADKWDAGAGGAADAEPREQEPAAKPAPRPLKPSGGLSSLLFSALALAVMGAATMSLHLGGEGERTSIGADQEGRRVPEVGAAAKAAPAINQVQDAEAGDPLQATDLAGLDLTKEGLVHPTGPSFDCSRVTSQTLKTICSHSELAAADAQMAQLYRSFLMNTDTPEELKEDQRQWLRKRDALSPEPAALLALYRARIRTFREAMPASLY